MAILGLNHKNFHQVSQHIVLLFFHIFGQITKTSNPHVLCSIWAKARRTTLFQFYFKGRAIRKSDMCKVGIKVEIKDQKLERHTPITKIMLASKPKKKNIKSMQLLDGVL